MKVDELYKVDILAFNSKIGYITNLGTTFYEMQSQYELGSPEYEEINRRLKLCCIEQNRTIDAAKGLKTKPFPKHWTSYQKINENDSDEEKQRKEFENKLVIDKRPEFMKYLYPRYKKEYKDFFDDFNTYSVIKFGKNINELTENDKQIPEIEEMIKYYHKKNPLLETNGVMNRLSRYMQKELKNINKTKANCDNQKIFESLFNNEIEIDNKKLDILKEKRKEYNDFKKEKQLKNSEFTTYEQYFKFLRNDCLEKISSDIKELANLAVYICYYLEPDKPKDFCWDVFGSGIVENLKLKNNIIKIPHICDDGNIEYLGNKYKIDELNISRDIEKPIKFENDLDSINEIFGDLEYFDEGEL